MPNRTMCEVLGEMRKCFQTYNFSPMLGLIEEVQSMGNRMEAALQDKGDISYYTKERDNLGREIKFLEQRKQELEAEDGQEEG